jgi:hypothetical protein
MPASTEVQSWWFASKHNRIHTPFPPISLSIPAIYYHAGTVPTTRAPLPRGRQKFIHREQFTAALILQTLPNLVGALRLAAGDSSTHQRSFATGRASMPSVVSFPVGPPRLPLLRVFLF